MTAAQYSILTAELVSDPLGRGYSVMSDAQVLASLNTVDRDNWVDVTSSQIFESIDITEFAALDAGQQARVDRILGLGIDIRTVPGSQARTELVSIFPGGGTTLSNLAAIANQQLSRAEELEIGSWITAGRVEQARV